MESGALAQKEDNLSELKSTNNEERRIKALHDGCCLIEEVMKTYEDWLKKNNRDASSYTYPFSGILAKHYGMYIFHKFYYHNDLKKFNYVDVALTCCYFVSKIQDSVLTLVNKISKFLSITEKAWMKICNRKLEDLVYIVPRLECILYQGIGFDLILDIPHKYVDECFKMSLNMKYSGADALVKKGPKPSYCTRYFLRYCLFSQLCVDERFDGRSIAAAAVDYALGATGLKNHKNYDPNWYEKMNSSPTAVGHKVLSASFIEEIQRERKLITPKIDACMNGPNHHSPIPMSEDNKRSYSGTEENRKRSRMGSPVIESIGQVKQETTQTSPTPLLSLQPSESTPLMPPSVMQTSAEPTPLIPSSVMQTSAEPTPLMPPSVMQTSTEPTPLMSSSVMQTSTEPTPLMSSFVIQTSTEPTPLMSSSVIQTSTEPTPLFSMDSVSVEPPPLFSSTSAPSLQSLVRVESADSPAPLFISQGAKREQEDAPLFSF